MPSALLVEVCHVTLWPVSAFSALPRRCQDLDWGQVFHLVVMCLLTPLMWKFSSALLCLFGTDIFEEQFLPHTCFFPPWIELFSFCLRYFLVMIRSLCRWPGCCIRDNVPFSGGPGWCSWCSSLLTGGHPSDSGQAASESPALCFCSLVSNKAAREEAL